MNVRTVIAYLSIDEDRTFDETDGPIDYVEKKTKGLVKSGIRLDDACIAQLSGWEPETNLVPLTFNEWKNKQ